MPATSLHRLGFLLCIASAAAQAGVGATSSGVLPTGAAGSTDPSAAVQQQSSGFVQQNQANAANNGTGVPQGGATATTINGVVQPAGAGSNVDGRDKALNAAGGNAAAAAAPATPPAPPPPPPTYVSNIKRVTPAESPAAGTSTTTVAATPVVAPVNAHEPALDPAPAAAAAAPTKPAPPRPVAPKPAPATATNAAVPAATAAAKAATAKSAAEVPAVVSGGSGAAPDGYTFYLGIGIALALLVFALATYLRTQQDETARRPG